MQIQPTCPVPLSNHSRITLGHGGGGKLTAELLSQVFLRAYGKPGQSLNDATAVELAHSPIAISTDSFVVRPLFFPGGSIGELAVNGTINDLAMSGAKPLYLTASFILEEGLEIVQLEAIANAMATAARKGRVQIIAGDTKVVERGRCDGCYINTTGIGQLPVHRQIAIDQARPGDVVLVSGTIGDHAMAVMSVREGLSFETAIVSDTAPLGEIVEQLLEACSNVRVLRDPTRGGLAATLNEIAAASQVGIEIEEPSIPVSDAVAAACEFLGLDVLQAANEGKFVVVVAAEEAENALAALRAHPLGRDAAVLGSIVEDRHQLVVMKTPLGAKRIVPLPIGEQLPRIC